MASGKSLQRMGPLASGPSQPRLCYPVRGRFDKHMQFLFGRDGPQQIKFVDTTRQVIGPRLDPALLQFQINGSQFSDIDVGDRDRRTVSHISHSELEVPFKELNITRINSRCHRDC